MLSPEDLPALRTMQAQLDNASAAADPALIAAIVGGLLNLLISKLGG
jgi:hypothetical protein